jgi:hypothetical protein
MYVVPNRRRSPMKRMMLALVLAAGVVLTGSTYRARVTAGEPTEVYPLSVVPGEPTAEVKRTYQNLEMVSRALMVHLTVQNRYPDTMEGFLRGPFGSWMVLDNPYHNRPVRLLDARFDAQQNLPINPAAAAGVSPDLYGDLALVRAEEQPGAVELRAYVPLLKDGRPYFMDRLPAPRDPERFRAIDSGLSGYFEGLNEKDRAVAAYSWVLRGSASEVGRTQVLGQRSTFSPVRSLADLKPVWWAVNPDLIRNPHTGLPMREVPLESPAPGEVTLLLIQTRGPVPEHDYQGLPHLRPSVRPLETVVIGYDSRGRAVYPLMLKVAVSLRPSSMPPLPREVVLRLLGEEHR